MTDMVAGRELDAKVAILMGWQITWPIDPMCHFAFGILGRKNVGINPVTGEEEVIPLYSTEIAAAWLVVEKMRELGYGFSLRGFTATGEPGFGCRFTHNERYYVSDAATAPLAICLVALEAVGEQT